MGKSDTLFSGILSLKLVPGSLTSCSTSGLVLSLSLNLKFNSSGSCDKFELGNNGVDSCTGEGDVSGMSLNFELNSWAASWDKYEFSNNGKDSCTGGGGVTCLSVNKKYKLNPVLY